MTGVVVLGFLALAAVAAVRWLPRGRSSAVRQVEAFRAAREVTNRWSADPATTPQPLQEFLAAQHHDAEGPSSGH